MSKIIVDNDFSYSYEEYKPNNIKVNILPSMVKFENINMLKEIGKC